MASMDVEDDNFFEEDEPLGEVLAAFEQGAKGLTMPPGWDRRIVVDYRYHDGSWRAYSPQLTGFDVRGRTLAETKSFVRQELDGFVDDTVTLVEVSTPELDDVVRLEDDFGREGTSEA